MSSSSSPVPLRFITAASLFDGHDAAINIMRRMLQASGAEVIHLAHNRSVQEIVEAAIQEDAQAIAVSSYQGGHMEYFRYMVDCLREQGAGYIRVFGGGGGVIVAEEIRVLQEYGVERIYSPGDGQQLGLQGIIDDMLERAEGGRRTGSIDPGAGGWITLARRISAWQDGMDVPTSGEHNALLAPVLGITGTGGAGKSSLTDELILRFRQDAGDRLRIAVLAVDPTRRRTGGALLGDRLRMNAIDHPSVYFRSLATRGAAAGNGGLPDNLEEIIRCTRSADVDLVIVETPGIGQGDAGIVPFVNCALYVMTPEFGAASQLEKIDMLDFADLVAINKFDRRGAEDARRDVSKQLQRNRMAFDQPVEAMPVFGTIASAFNDDGVTGLYQALRDRLFEAGMRPFTGQLAPVETRVSTRRSVVVPPARQRYLADIADVVRAHHERAAKQSRLAREIQQLASARDIVTEESGVEAGGGQEQALDAAIEARRARLDGEARGLLEEWPALRDQYSGDELVTSIRDREQRSPLYRETLSGTRVPRVALPRWRDQGEILYWLMRENVPGRFPYTAGVFALRRKEEDPTRMFAGEGDAFRTNRRFHLLSAHAPAKRLSTAFDSVTLYGFDPAERPDIHGKIGNAGVSIATLDDMKVLYDGFDLCDPSTSVSMTINGPAPAILAMFLNTAIDQQRDRFVEREGRRPDADEYGGLRARALRAVRGTVQADILKEDQGQNTCIFSTEFSLKMMGDIQQWFIDNEVRNFYSVSISGYHIAEAGANPISQLAFTLANGFTFVEAFLARGMDIDDFAHNLSFFFSCGMDAEYPVLGRVARRIWAVALRDRYGAGERGRKLKYHIQTSGRSLHAREMAFNDIRTTLQALIALQDNCNSLHTNAYDEAVTTPTAASVRRAMAIQLIINREWGLSLNENSNQGAFIIEELTDLVEEAVLQEFERISERGGVLGAMETGYQRGRIQDESLLYEHRKHDGSLPVIGVNTFLGEEQEDGGGQSLELARSTEEEKGSQIERLRAFHQRHADRAPEALDRLQQVALEGGNVFDELMHTVRYCSLGQITDAFFAVGGQYRRTM